MPDREKVIRGLAQVSEYTRAKADIAVVGKAKEIFDSWFRAVEDAIALLREQEPRVLTWEEAKKAEVCWLEQRGYEPYATDDADTWNPEVYGKVYRCWSLKPTDEQRKEIKWG